MDSGTPARLAPQPLHCSMLTAHFFPQAGHASTRLKACTSSADGAASAARSSTVAPGCPARSAPMLRPTRTGGSSSRPSSAPARYQPCPSTPSSPYPRASTSPSADARAPAMSSRRPRSGSGLLLLPPAFALPGSLPQLPQVRQLPQLQPSPGARGRVPPPPRPQGLLLGGRRATPRRGSPATSPAGHSGHLSGGRGGGVGQGDRDGPAGRGSPRHGRGGSGPSRREALPPPSWKVMDAISTSPRRREEEGGAADEQRGGRGGAPEPEIQPQAIRRPSRTVQPSHKQSPPPPAGAGRAAAAGQAERNEDTYNDFPAVPQPVHNLHRGHIISKQQQELVTLVEDVLYTRTPGPDGPPGSRSW